MEHSTRHIHTEDKRMIKQKHWLIMTKDRSVIAVGTPRNRQLIDVAKYKGERLLTYRSKGRAENGFKSSWFYEKTNHPDLRINNYDTNPEALEAVEVDIEVTESGKPDLLQQLNELGVCPECLTVPEMDEEGPWSDCNCGTGEDYAKRPLQKLQLLEREIDQMTDPKTMRERFEMTFPIPPKVYWNGTRYMTKNGPESETAGRYQSLWVGFEKACELLK